MQLFFNPVKQNEQIIGFTVFIQDLTKRIRNEMLIQQNQENLLNIFKNLSIGIAIHQNNTILYANPAFYQIIGYDSAEMQTIEHFKTILLPEFKEKFETYCQNYYAHSTEIDYELSGIHKQGYLFTVLANSSPVFFDNETCTLTSFVDITEKRAHEEAQLRLQANLLALIENSPMRIFSVDRNFRLLFGNHRFLEGYRHKYRHVLQSGENILHYMPHSEKIRLEQTLQRVL